MTKIKQKYIKPEVKVYQIDSDISLQMTSEGNPPEPTPPTMPAQQRKNVSSNPFEQNPFGE